MSDIKEVAISFPFTLTSQGTVQTTTSQDKIWADRVLAAVGTGGGERILRQEFGSRIYVQQFSTISEAEDVITREIGEVFNLFLPLLTLRDVITSFSQDTRVLTVEVLYSLPDETTANVKVGSVLINNNQPPEEN